MSGRRRELSLSKYVAHHHQYVATKYATSVTDKALQILHVVEYSSKLWHVSCLRFSPDGEDLIVCFKSGEILEINRTTGEVLWSRLASPVGLRCVQYCSRIPFIFACNRLGELSLHKKIDDVNYPLNPDIHGISWFDVDPPCRYLFCGCVNGELKIVELPTAKVLRVFKNNLSKPGPYRYHQMRISNVMPYPEHKNVFLSSSLDSTVKLWDLRTHRGVVGDIRGPYVLGDALDVLNDKVLTGSNRATNCLQLWDVRVPKMPLTINPLNELDNLHGQYVQTCKFLKSESKNFMIATDIGGLGYLALINSVNRKTVARFDYNMRIKIKSIDCFDKYIAFGGSKNAIIIGQYG